MLLLLSDLAEHTRHLRAEPRCSILVGGAAAEANPQTAPRVTVTGVAGIVDDPALKAALPGGASLCGALRRFRRFPSVAHPAGGRAVRRRIRPRGALAGGGSGPDAGAVAAVAAAAGSIMEHCNRDHPDALARIAGRPGVWRMVAADVDGCDLAAGERVVRLAWHAPVEGPEGVRAELVRLAHEG